MPKDSNDALLVSMRQLVASNKEIIFQLENRMFGGGVVIGEAHQNEHLKKTVAKLKDFTRRMEELETQIRSFDSE
ncbi:MAG: hypothetical protein KUL82_02250 [Bdellovibrio sp.]|uniref:hypothetical protein n=1 Tax=Bdellovibrio sp. TaxID=28201 RepID=UPI0039E214DB|nr:hypothetical protein [Bdellovibrio sp.]